MAPAGGAEAGGDSGRGGTPRVSLRARGCLWGLLALTALVYAGSLTGGYVYEDIRDGVYPADDWPGWALTWTPVLQGHPYKGTEAVSRSVGHLTDMDPRVQRAVSLGWHLLNGWLLWCLARRVFPAHTAVLAVGIFLLHPLQTESVAYIAARSEVLSATALLLALLAAERGWWVVAWVVAAGAVVGKPTGVLALALVPLWASWRGLPSWTPIWRVTWAAACVLPIAAASAVIQQRGLLWSPLDEMARTLAAWTRLLTLWVLPWGQTIDHDWAAIPAWVGVWATLAWLGAGVWAVRHWASSWSLAFFMSALVVLPRAVWQLGEGLHEHHLYTPSLALSLASAAWLTREAPCPT